VVHILQEFHLNIKYKTGSTYRIVDCLNRSLVATLTTVLDSCDHQTYGWPQLYQKDPGFATTYQILGVNCWVCVIFFARVVVFERLRRARRGVRGGAEPPTRGVRGQRPRNFFFGPTYFRREPTYFRGPTYFRDDIFPDHMILGGFSAHGFLPMVFYFRLRN
jgi:hypothetical protein